MPRLCRCAGYWAIRGLAAPIRLLLAHCAVDFEDRLYKEGDTAVEAEWFEKDKPALAAQGVPFPNLPYWVDGDVKITQSLAILRYLGAKHGLLGGAPGTAGSAAVDVALYQVVDFRRQLSGCAYTNKPTVAEYRDAELPKWLKGFEAALTRGPWVAGDSLSIADFALWEVVDSSRALVKEAGGGADALAAFPHVAAFMARFEALPNIKAYISGPAFLARPYNGDSAQFR